MELDHQELMFEALKDVLPNLLRFSTKQLISKYGKEKTEEALGLLMDYVIGSCGKELSRNEVLALYVKVIRCLSDYIKGQLAVPVTLNTLMSNFHLLDFAVSLQFPGYSESGFLKAIISPRNLKSMALERAS